MSKLEYFVSANQQTPTAGAATQPASPPNFGLQSILGPVQIGRDYSGNFALSIRGLAVLRPDGTYVALDRDGDALVDVSLLILPGLDPWVVRLPVPRRSVAPGDLLIMSDTPFTCLYVLEKEGPERILGLDPIAGQIVRSVPQRNLIFNFVVRALSLFDAISLRRDKDKDDKDKGAGGPKQDMRPQVKERQKDHD